MKFCSECSNMYYIKIDDNDESQLIYYCRNCGNKDTNIEDGGVCVINTQLKKGSQHFEHIVNKYTKLDPTLPRIYNIPCPNSLCTTNITHTSKNKENIDTSREILYIRYDHNKLKYLYMCCKCDTIWS
jgi:DNA-directed RNA polymerase subunit M/transcription elongation factor TFIIS